MQVTKDLEIALTIVLYFLNDTIFCSIFMLSCDLDPLYDATW